jgi:hypothetical protein
MEKNAADALTRAIRYAQKHENTVQNLYTQLGKTKNPAQKQIIQDQINRAQANLDKAKKTMSSAPKERLAGATEHISNVDKTNKSISKHIDAIESDDVTRAYQHNINNLKGKSKNLNEQLNAQQQQKPKKEGILSRIRNFITGNNPKEIDKNQLTQQRLMEMQPIRNERSNIQKKQKDMESGLRERKKLLGNLEPNKKAKDYVGTVAKDQMAESASRSRGYQSEKSVGHVHFLNDKVTESQAINQANQSRKFSGEKKTTVVTPNSRAKHDIREGETLAEARKRKLEEKELAKQKTIEQVQAQQPVVQAQQPVVQAQQPVVQAQQPVVQAQQPVVQAQQPVVQAQQPVVQAQQPVVQAQQPVVQAQQPSGPSIGNLVNPNYASDPSNNKYMWPVLGGSAGLLAGGYALGRSNNDR